MHNILYVHGFNSSGNSNTVRNLRAAFADYNVYSDDFDLLDLSGTQDKIARLLCDYHIDLLAGSSFGAFHILQCETDIPRIVINPCMYPSVELPKLDDTIDERVIAELREWETRYSPCRHDIFGIFGKDDELFSYKDEFIRLYGYTNSGTDNHIMIAGHHRLNSDELLSGFIPAVKFLYP